VKTSTSLGDLTFLIDTGTQKSILFLSSLKQPSIRLEKKSTTLIGIGKSKDFHSHFSESLTFHFSSLPEHSMDVIVLDKDFENRPVTYDGILGLDFLESYCVQIDMPSQIMELFPQSSCNDSDSNWIGLPTKWKQSSILIRIKIKFPNSKVISTYASVDTGSNGSLLLDESYRHVSGLSENPMNTASVKVSGVSGTVGADMISACKVLLGDGPVMLTGNVLMARGRFHPRSSIFAPLSGVPDTNLGTGFLGLLQLRLDPIHKTVFVHTLKQ
jgi:hypothetical protein